MTTMTKTAKKPRAVSKKPVVSKVRKPAAPARVAEVRTRKPVAKKKKVELRVFVDADLLAGAEKIFREVNYSTDDGVNLLLRQVVLEQDIPFIPNAETIEAIEEARAGKCTPTSLEELRKIWNEA